MNTKPNVSRFADLANITIQPNTAAKAKEEKDDYNFSVISRGHFACDSIKATHIIIDKDGKIGCSCGDMTYRCTDNNVCKHIAMYLDLKVPPQTPAPGELIKKLILMGWVGGKDDLHPAEMLKHTPDTPAQPKPYEEPDPVLDQVIPEMPEPPNEYCSNCTTETVHYECPNCGESVDISHSELADWILNHLYICPGKKATEQNVVKKMAQKLPEIPEAPEQDEDATPAAPSGDYPSSPNTREVIDLEHAPTPFHSLTPNLATALCNMQKIDLLAVTDSKNPFHNAKYADLASVWAAIRKPLTDNGLAVLQTTEPYQDGITVVTTLLHTSGESTSARLSCEVPKSKPDKNGQVKPNIQGLGSTITYLRRYSLIAMVGVAPIDDDGEAAMGR